MYGKYHDSRVYQHLVHTYSRVPYLDHEIFNVETQALRESTKANKRALTAQKGKLSFIKVLREPKKNQKCLKPLSRRHAVKRRKKQKTIYRVCKRVSKGA